jgi:hypothetical protein
MNAQQLSPTSGDYCQLRLPCRLDLSRVAECTTQPTHLIGHPDSFATGYQTLVAIIQGVAFGTLIVNGQNVIFRGGSISQHLTAAGQLITTFTVIAAVTYEYLQLVRAVQWSPRLADTTVPYLLRSHDPSIISLLARPQSCWLCGSAHAQAQTQRPPRRRSQRALIPFYASMRTRPSNQKVRLLLPGQS